jgi:uncharacterized protein YecE (DUF72 family)
LPVRLAALAAGGIRIGTSTWTYPGWMGTVYSEARYQHRGRFSETRFRQCCLEEYARVFPCVGVDSSYYTFPTEKGLREMATQTPADFRFSFKVTDEITIRRFPALPRHGQRAGMLNPNFLNADLFVRLFLEPLTAIHSKVGMVMFEFSRFGASDFQRGREFVAALDEFLSRLPRGWNYGVEVRNKNLLQPEFFAMLRSRGVAHVFNLWSGGISLEDQLGRDAWTAPVAGARLLTRTGTVYEERDAEMAPYDRIQQPWPEARAAAVTMIREAQRRGVPMFVHVGNKLEGCSPLSVAALVESLGPAAV